MGRPYKNEIFNKTTKYIKCVKRCGFLSFARNFGDKYGKKVMDTARKTRIGAAKTASKRVAQKTAKATGDLIGNLIADKITQLGKTKSKEKENERQAIYIAPQKTANYWWLKIVLISCKNGIPKNHKLIRYNTRRSA